MPKIVDVKFDIGEKVKIKSNGQIGTVGAILVDSFEILYQVGYQIFKPINIETHGTYFKERELEKIGG